MSSKLSTRVETTLNPTENEEKVKRAISNLFPVSSFEMIERQGTKFVVAELEGKEGLSRLRDLFRLEKIRDAAHEALLEGKEEMRIVFYLNKQAAYARRVSFSLPEAESPLGPIKVEISCEDPIALIDWLAPRTSKR